ncbi:hypothetical protein Hanom_Chr17g01531021 [Helianthus anomalus]
MYLLINLSTWHCIPMPNLDFLDFFDMLLSIKWFNHFFNVLMKDPMLLGINQERRRNLIGTVERNSIIAVVFTLVSYEVYPHHEVCFYLPYILFWENCENVG